MALLMAKLVLPMALQKAPQKVLRKVLRMVVLLAHQRAVPLALLTVDQKESTSPESRWEHR